MPLEYEEMKKFDLDLKFGHLGEDFVRDMQGDNTKIEVKTEREIWKNTGNIAIEYRYNGKPSGISTTGSEIWIHLLTDNGNIVGGFIFKVSQLKDYIKKLQREKRLKTTDGGDFDASKMVLLPIKDIKELF